MGFKNVDSHSFSISPLPREPARVAENTSGAEQQSPEQGRNPAALLPLLSQPCAAANRIESTAFWKGMKAEPKVFPLCPPQ